MTIDYSVNLTLAVAEGGDILDLLCDALEPVGGWASRLFDGSYNVTFDLPAVGPYEAVTAGTRRFDDLKTEGRIVGVAARRWDEVQREADAIGLPELVGASEIADLLGVSRQRVHQLTTHTGFPAPLVQVRMGPLWDAKAVAAFDRQWERKPGRPPRTNSEAAGLVAS